MNANEHPTADLLARFAARMTSAEERRGIVRHLLAGCEECKLAAQETWALAAGDDSRRPVRSLRPRALAEDAITRLARFAAERHAEFERERAAADQAISELMSHPQLRRETLVRNSRRFQTYALCERLLDAAYPALFRDTHEAAALARLAIEVADGLDAERYGRIALADLRSRAWAMLGNTQRACGELREANASLDQAQALAEDGSGDPELRAQLLYFRSMVRWFERRLGEAMPLAEQALGIYRRVGNEVGQARCLVGKALVSSHSGDYETGIPLLLQARDLVQGHDDPYLESAVEHNLLFRYSQLGKIDEAVAQLPRVRALLDRLPDAKLNRIRFRWAEAALQRGTGNTAAAESAYLAVVEGLTEAGLPYPAAVVCVELALMYLDLGRTAEVRKLASHSLPVFRALGISVEANAALALFARAAQTDTLTAALLLEVRNRLEKAQSAAGATFHRLH